MTLAQNLPTEPGRAFILREARVGEATLVLPVDAPADREGCRIVDVLIADGKIADIAARIDADLPVVPLDGGQVWPRPVEIHTHLDKGHIAPRARNPDGTTRGAAEAVRRDREANWTTDDVERRFDFSLRCAYAHGTAAIRSHLDCYGAQSAITWSVFARMREVWAGRVDLQGVTMTLLDNWGGDDGRALADLTAKYGGALGGVTKVAGPPAAQIRSAILAGLDTLFALATERGLDIDLHVDETSDLEPDTLRLVAETALRRRFKGRLVCGHVCSLSLRPEREMRETIALAREAGLAVVSLPLVNLHLQDRAAGRTPRWRGVAPLSELDAAGVPVAVSNDNARDPFHRFGDLDAVELFRESVRICQLDLEGMRWLKSLSTTPADLMGLLHRGRLAVGLSADLLLFRARTLSELLSRPQSDRVALAAGRPIEASLPDYRELDRFVGRP
jgi:cytosine/creatinine deaminase